MSYATIIPHIALLALNPESYQKFQEMNGLEEEALLNSSTSSPATDPLITLDIVQKALPIGPNTTPIQQLPFKPLASSKSPGKGGPIQTIAEKVRNFVIPSAYATTGKEAEINESQKAQTLGQESRPAQGPPGFALTGLIQNNAGFVSVRGGVIAVAAIIAVVLVAQAIGARSASRRGVSEQGARGATGYNIGKGRQGLGAEGVSSEPKPGNHNRNPFAGASGKIKVIANFISSRIKPQAGKENRWRLFVSELIHGPPMGSFFVFLTSKILPNTSRGEESDPFAALMRILNRVKSALEAGLLRFKKARAPEVTSKTGTDTIQPRKGLAKAGKGNILRTTTNPAAKKARAPEVTSKTGTDTIDSKQNAAPHSTATNLSIISHNGFRYIQGPKGIMANSVAVPIICGQQVEILGMQLGGDKYEVIGMGDRFEEGCAFVNVMIPDILNPLSKLRTIYGVYEFLLKDISSAEWKLAYAELKKYSKQDPEDIKIEALRKLILNNKSRFRILYENLTRTQVYHPDALLLLIISAYELGIEKYGMITFGEAKKDSRVFAYKPGTELVILGQDRKSGLLAEARRRNQRGESIIIVTVGGDIHANINPLLVPEIMENSTSLLFGTTLINVCKYLNLTIVNGTAESIEANRERFVTKKDGIEYGVRGYEFYRDILRITPVGYVTAAFIKENRADKIENRLILIHNDGKFYPARDAKINTGKDVLAVKTEESASNPTKDTLPTPVNNIPAVDKRQAATVVNSDSATVKKGESASSELGRIYQGLIARLRT